MAVNDANTAEKQRLWYQEQQIRAALNQQTAVQFRVYAQEQFPNDIEKV